MAKPSEVPAWATDTNYSSGPDVGTATKVDPGAGVKAQGHVPGTRGAAQTMNWWKNLVGSWIDYLDEETTPLIDGSREWAHSIANFSELTLDGSPSVQMNSAFFASGAGIAVGGSKTIQLTANAGASWTAATAAAAGSPTFNVATRSSSDFVIAGSSGAIETSPDGLTWTGRTADGSYSDTFHGGAWSSGIGLSVLVGALGEIQTSPTGATWTQQTAAGSFSDTFRAAAASDSLFVVVGGTVTGEIQTSPDGSTWTSRTSARSVGIYGVAFNGGRFVAGGADGLQYSDDGIAWTASGGATVSNVSSVAATDYGFIAVTSSGNAYISRDGATFVNVPTRSSHALYFVAWDGVNRRTLVGGVNGVVRGSLFVAPQF